VATLAGRAVARWATDALGITRLVWRAALGNHGSRLVAQRIGFTMEGLLRGDHEGRDGEPEDCWVGSLRPGEMTDATPAHLAAGSAAARRAEVFGGPQPTLVLTGVDGTLRPYAEADVPRMVRACRDPDTQMWTPVPAGYQPSDGQAYIARMRRLWLRGDGASWAVAGPDGGYLGGTDIGVSDDDPGVGEIGFQVAPWARGQGLATAAARAVAEWGFDALGLRRVVWRAYLGNHRSRRVAEKAGFRFEGVARDGITQRGVRRDAWIGAMLASDRRGGGHAPAMATEEGRNSG
jgi:RimJ/RimL family protein N-acetyltransferase